MTYQLTDIFMAEETQAPEESTEEAATEEKTEEAAG